MSKDVVLDGLLAIQFNADATIQLNGIGDTFVWPGNVPLYANASKLTVSNPANFTVAKMKDAKGARMGHVLPFFNIDSIQAY